MDAIRRLRVRAGLTQAKLAQLGGTSQPAIAAYEAGRKTPTLRTLDRLTRAAGFELAVDFVVPLTREDRRSLALHAAVIEQLQPDPIRRAGPLRQVVPLRRAAPLQRAAPVQLIARARRTLDLMRGKHPNARPLLRAWDVLLDLAIPDLIDVLRDPRPHARALRQVSPFAGVLTAAERAQVYRRFQSAERGRVEAS